MRALLFALFLPAAAQAAPPPVVADIAPVQSLAAQVMDGAGEPALLIRAGDSPHGGQLRPAQARMLAGAGLVVQVGAGLSPWLEHALEDRAAVLTLADVPGVTHLPLREGADFGGHDHAHEEGEEEPRDPHLWLDPRNAALWLDAIAEALGAADPENAALYAANAAQGREALKALEAEIAAMLAPVKDRPFLLYHDMLHAFEARFGLTGAGALAEAEGRAPGPQRLRAVRDLVREQGIACVLAEPQQPEAALRRVTEGSNARIGTLDPLGATLEPGPGLYAALLRGVAAALVACLGQG